MWYFLCIGNSGLLLAAGTLLTWSFLSTANMC
jgi:hypothetical protein